MNKFLICKVHICILDIIYKLQTHLSLTANLSVENTPYQTSILTLINVLGITGCIVQLRTIMLMQILVCFVFTPRVRHLM